MRYPIHFLFLFLHTFTKQFQIDLLSGPQVHLPKYKNSQPAPKLVQQPQANNLNIFPASIIPQLIISKTSGKPAQPAKFKRDKHAQIVRNQISISK